jgi:hypothetical protein
LLWTKLAEHSKDSKLRTIEISVVGRFGSLECASLLAPFRAELAPRTESGSKLPHSKDSKLPLLKFLAICFPVRRRYNLAFCTGLGHLQLAIDADVAGP